jgi:hypothetical protein
MKLATLLGWSLAASLLAACSGGAGSVAPVSPANNNNAGTQGIALHIGGTAIGSSSSARRSPDYIGTNVNTIAYTITPGPISGTFTGSGTVFSGCTAMGSPVTQVCNITIAPGTYAITVTLKQGSTVVGSGTAMGLVVNSGMTTPAAVSINPVNANPTLSIPNSPFQFYNDGQPQNIQLTANELDPAGDIITTYYGPVGNYPTLSFTDSGGTTGVGLPATIMAAPGMAAQTGNVNQTLTYNGTAGNTTSLGVTLSDGTSTSSVTVPFVRLANNANNPSAGQITFSGIGAPNALTVTVTETTSAASGGLDAHFTSASAMTPCGGHATFSPALGSNATSGAGPNVGVTYTITAVDANLTTCELDVASVNDPNLTTPITINFPGTIGTTVSSHNRR